MLSRSVIARIRLSLTPIVAIALGMVVASSLLGFALLIGRAMAPGPGAVPNPLPQALDTDPGDPLVVADARLGDSRRAGSRAVEPTLAPGGSVAPAEPAEAVLALLGTEPNSSTQVNESVAAAGVQQSRPLARLLRSPHTEPLATVAADVPAGAGLQYRGGFALLGPTYTAAGRDGTTSAESDRPWTAPGEEQEGDRKARKKPDERSRARPAKSTAEASDSSGGPGRNDKARAADPGKPSKSKSSNPSGSSEPAKPSRSKGESEASGSGKPSRSKGQSKGSGSGKPSKSKGDSKASASGKPSKSKSSNPSGSSKPVKPSRSKGESKAAGSGKPSKSKAEGEESGPRSETEKDSERTEKGSKKS